MQDEKQWTDIDYWLNIEVKELFTGHLAMYSIDIQQLS